MRLWAGAVITRPTINDTRVGECRSSNRDAPRVNDLKLIALDPEDLNVLSCHLQDAVMRVGEMTYLKSDMRFAVIANRFDWEGAVKKSDGAFERRRCGLRFERVKSAKTHGIDLSKKDAVLALLAIGFDPDADPEGIITLHFAGGAAIRLEVECIEAEMRDLGAAWQTRHKPAHASDEPSDAN